MKAKINLHNALDAALSAARLAWCEVCHFYRGEYSITEKVDGPATEADHQANQVIVRELEKKFPRSHYGYLSEEIKDDRERLDHQWLWIIDPIDGTKDFIEGTGNFAMHIGLAGPMNGHIVPMVGVVYHPLPDRAFCAIRGEGAFVMEPPETDQPGADDKRRLAVSDQDDIARMRAVISYSHRTRKLVRLMDRLPIGEYFSMGSMGLKMATVAGGLADFYLNISRGKFKEWDICAPHIIVEEAGGRFTDLDGHSIYYNKEDYVQPVGVLASNGQRHDELLGLISEQLEAMDSEAQPAR